METTQTNLLSAVRDAQDSKAWGSFYRIYSTMVSHFARRMGLPEADADDVSQEVLMIVHDSLLHGRYNARRGRFRSWLYGVARRQSLARLRDRRRRTRAQWVADTGVDLLDQLEDRSDDPSLILWQQEWRYAVLAEALRHVQGQIGETVFMAFQHYAIERQPVEQVARRLGIATSSVYVYKGRVLSAVRDWIDQFEHDDEEPDPIGGPQRCKTQRWGIEK